LPDRPADGKRVAQAGIQLWPDKIERVLLNLLTPSGVPRPTEPSPSLSSPIRITQSSR
jgi:hypothetical protein